MGLQQQLFMPNAWTWLKCCSYYTALQCGVLCQQVCCLCMAWECYIIGMQEVSWNLEQILLIVRSESQLSNNEAVINFNLKWLVIASILFSLYYNQWQSHSHTYVQSKACIQKNFPSIFLALLQGLLGSPIRQVTLSSQLVVTPLI